MNPHDVAVELPVSTPVEKITSYTQALSDMGLMTLIYSPGEMKIQSQDITDKTGASASTGSEIQRNITEIMKSTLNSMGGQITFIEYDPSYIQNQMVTGYSNFEYKTVPDVVVTGGITEFDRGLETHSEGTNIDAEMKATGLPSWFPGDSVGGGFGDTSKAGKARITLDFNLKDFQTLAGLPKMTTTNSMEVFKGLHEKEFGITFFGPSFGMKGSTKRVQGRHEAIRLLVQLSMIQMVGKYLSLPYWILLGDDAQPDPVVLDSIRTTYYNMEPLQQLLAVQQWLILHGQNVMLTGELDTATKIALQRVDPSFSESMSLLPEETFTKVYITIPVDHSTLGRRKQLDNMLVEMYNELAQEPEEQMEQQAVEDTAPPQQMEESISAQSAEPAYAAPQADNNPAPARKSFGRRLSEEEW